MSRQFWLSDEQVERLQPHFPKAWGKPWVDDRRVLSGIPHVLRNGLRWQNAPAVHGPQPRIIVGHDNLYSPLGRLETGLVRVACTCLHRVDQCNFISSGALGSSFYRGTVAA